MSERGGGGVCTPGAEFMCGASPGYVCVCACGGKNHGKYRWLKAERDAEGPWSAQEARAKLREAQGYEAQGVLSPFQLRNL